MTYESRPSHLFSGLGLASMAAGGARPRPTCSSRRSRATAIGGRPLLIAAVVLALGGLQLVLFGLLAELQVYSPAARAGVTATRHASWWRSPPVVLAVTTVLAVLGAFHTGVTTDEPIHVMRLRNFFDTGWYALDWDYSRQPGPAATAPTPTSTHRSRCCCCTAGRCSGASRAGTTSPRTAHAYDVRHLGVVVIGLVGLVAVAAIGRVRAARAGAGGSSPPRCWPPRPLWTGHEMFNVKDVPVATGHTLATLGLLLLVRRPAARWPLRLARAGCLVAGLVLTLGTRPGMWSGALGPAGRRGGRACLLVADAPGARRGRASASWRRRARVAAAALVAIYPNLFGSPLRALPRTSESSSSFLAGEKSDRLYVPRHLVEDLPDPAHRLRADRHRVVVVVLLVRAGAATAVGRRPARAGRRSRRSRCRCVAIVLRLRPLPRAAPAALRRSRRSRCWRRTAWLVLGAAPAAGARAAGWSRWSAGAALVAADGRPGHAAAVPDDVRQPGDRLSCVGDRPDDKRPGGDYWRVSIPELVAHAALDRQLLCKATDAPRTPTSPTRSPTAARPSRPAGARTAARRPTGRWRRTGCPSYDGCPATEYDAVFIGPLPAQLHAARRRDPVAARVRRSS